MVSIVYRKERNIVTVSPSSRDDLLSKGFKKENISLVYNGIESKILEKVEKEDSVIKIVSLGRIVTTKYIDRAIEMIEYTVKELGIKNVLLQILGKGPDEERLKTLVKEKGLEEYVKFLGFVSEQEKEKVLTESHLHIQFSQKEGWGITVIEAASKGTPTICYPVPGLVDSVNDNTGYFIKDNMMDTWREVIRQIQNSSEEYKQKQLNCLKWAKNFEWGNQKNLFLEKVKYIVNGSVNR
jgi:glycosyltransferase involved in cell wall biosynthesis